MAWFTFRNQTRLIHKDNMLPFWQLTAFSTLCNKAVWSPLFVSLFFLSFPFSVECQICHLHSFKREMWLVSRHHGSGILCDPVELPVFQQRKGRLSKHREFGEAYCIADPSSRGWALGSHCHSQAIPQDPLELAYILARWLVVRIGCSVLL